jgi:ParB family transcriptional regulator, chromosome partitioning protein
MASRHGLGRGLAALLSAPAPTPAQAAYSASPEVRDPVALDLPIDAISANPNQPRKDFDDEALHALAASLKRSGLLQPVVVRRKGQDRYELVVGERRWRAARIAGLTTVPAILRDADDPGSLELALVENLLREDLNPIEEAEAFQRLLAEFGWTQEQLGERVGRDRSSVANCLRLLKLPVEIQADLRVGRLTMGHARALLSLSSPAEQLRLRAEILAHSWSVRATEEDVQKRRVPSPRGPGRRSAELAAVEEDLRRRLATRVRIVGTESRGRIEIVYATHEELERLTDHLRGAR